MASEKDTVSGPHPLESWGCLGFQSAVLIPIQGCAFEMATFSMEEKERILFDCISVFPKPLMLSEC